MPSEQNQIICDSAFGHQRDVKTAAAVSLGNENTDLVIDLSCENSNPLPPWFIDVQKKELPLPILSQSLTQPIYA